MSLRSRILLLVLLATFAPAGALAWYLFVQRDHEVDKARAALGAIAATVADDLNDKLSGTVQLLHGLSRAPDLDTTHKASCSDFLAEVLARYPQYTGLLTITPTGELHCDSLRTGRKLDVSQRAYFKQAKATLSPAFDVVFGGLTGIAVMQVAYPVPDGAGGVKLILLASLNLSQFARNLAAGSQYREMQLLFWSRDGTLMVREPDAGGTKLAGKKLAESDLFRFTSGGALGDTVELPGSGGTQAIWALGIPPEPQGSGLRINVGLPHAVLVAAANQGLAQALAILAGASLLAVLGALFVAERGIRRHAVRMMDVAARVGGGDLGARIGEPYPRGEIGELMAVFDATIGAVQVQRAALEESGASLRRSNRMLRMLSGINTVIVHVQDRDALFHEACRVAVEAGEFRMAWIGMVEPGTRRLVPAAWRGADEAYLRLMPLDLRGGDPARQGLAGQAVDECRAIYIDDMQSDARISLRSEAAERGFRSLAVLPLIVGGKAAGVLALYAPEVGFFHAGERKLLDELAGDIAFAMGNIEKSEKLEFLARYDPLTSLANSALFHERVASKVLEAHGAQRKLAVFVIDVDRFKTINDTLGREAGDELLRQFAARLVATDGGSERFARVGADHFAALTAGVRSAGDVARLAETLMAQCVSAPFAVGGSELRISVKAGIALYPDDGADAATLFRNAEAALKKAKAGGEKYLFYTPQMSERIAENLSLENQLRLALERDEFVLHYQPKVDVENRRLVGLEALIRWQSPELGLVPPAKFISMLEETGLILPVGAWALERAALDRKGWVEAGLNAPRVAVNVSAIQLRQRNFVETVKQSILKGASPAGIDIEITESVLMEDIEGNVAKLREIQKLGLRIAMDDFGTGYSSLAYLAKLPLHTLKIDRAFISTMLDDPDIMTLVSTMISLAHSLRLAVVAEGVDSEEQAKMLRLLRCEEMQGFLVSRPLPKADILPLFGEGTKA